MEGRQEDRHQRRTARPKARQKVVMVAKEAWGNKAGRALQQRQQPNPDGRKRCVVVMVQANHRNGVEEGGGVRTAKARTQESNKGKVGGGRKKSRVRLG